MATIEARLTGIGFSHDAGTEIRERIGDDYMPAFLGLVAREVAHLEPSSSIPFNKMADADLQVILDEMGIDMSDAFADDPEKWLDSPVMQAVMLV